jgi:hypothetical protein
VERIHRVARREGPEALAEEVDQTRRLESILEELNELIIHRALAA